MYSEYSLDITDIRPMKFISKLFKYIGILLLVLIAVYLLGPRSDYPTFTGKVSPLSLSLHELEPYIQAQNAAIKNLKEDNEARLIWADSMRKTPYALVYLHGFSASPQEGYPTNVEFAKRYGMNYYAPILAGHGVEGEDVFLTITPADWINSAKEAIATGQLIGEKVIVMSCSTGSTLSVYLAAENPDEIAAQIMYSPNIDLHDPTSELLTMPWGEQILKQMVGERRHSRGSTEGERYKYTTQSYRVEGIIALKALIEATMTDEIFAKNKTPYFVGYWYKNEEQCDHVISIPDIEYFDEHTTTPKDQKWLMAFPNANTHVVPSGLHNNDLKTVQKATYDFAENVLGLKAIK